MSMHVAQKRHIASLYRLIPAAMMLAALVIAAPVRAEQSQDIKRPVVEVDTSVLMQYGRASGNPANPVVTPSGRLTEPERFSGDMLVAPILGDAAPRKPLLTGAPPTVKGVPVASAAVPAKKPAPQAAQAENHFPAIANPPVPPRRPATQYASKDFVKQARQQVGTSPAPQYQVRHQPIPGVPAMPARPAGKVVAETTYLPKSEDAENALLKRMMQMDRTQVLAGVQDVAGRTEKSAPPTTNLPAALFKSGAQHPVPSGPNGPVTSERIAAQNDIGTEKIAANVAEGLAAVEPAAGVAPSISSALITLPEGAYQGATALSSLPLAGDGALSDELRASLTENIIPALQKERDTRLQLQSFADHSAGGPLSARRTALSRALALRAFLMEHGIEAHRLEMRALGLPAANAPAGAVNRIDLVLIRDQAA